MHSQEMEEGGGPPTYQRALPARDQVMEGKTPTRTCAPLLRSQYMEEGGLTLTQQRALPARIQGIEGDTLTRQRDPPA